MFNTRTDFALNKFDKTAIPDDVVDTLTRCLLPKIQEYFESPEGQAEFEEWKRRQTTA